MRCVIEEVDNEELTASRKLFLRKMLTLEAFGGGGALPTWLKGDSAGMAPTQLYELSKFFPAFIFL